MTKVDLKKAFTVPQSVFDNPQEVVQCRELSHDDKVKVLRNWKQELVQLQKAGEENMLDERSPSERSPGERSPGERSPGEHGPSDIGSRLSAVTQAMTALDEGSRP